MDDRLPRPLFFLGAIDMMARISDSDYLRSDQYRDGTNLRTRMDLHERFSVNKYGWHPWVLDQLKFAPQSRVLELGCGPCFLWAENLHRVPVGWTVVLSDFSGGMLGEAQENLRESTRRFGFVQADIQTIPFAHETFDGVIANHMLYHVPDRQKAYGEIRRVLKPGGKFYAATNGRVGVHRLQALMEKVEPGISSPLAGGSFSLESGGPELEQWFSTVHVYRYEDALAVTEVDPLVDYVASGERLSEAGLARFRDLMAAEMAQHGVIRIEKAPGMFEAY